MEQTIVQVTPFFGILVIAVVELYALKKGRNGKALALALALVAGLSGFSVGELIRMVGG